jgi:ATP-binding cassette subfamily C protein LapB
MRQKLALAIVMASDCPLVILDEPTANLDPQTEQAFIKTLKSYSADRTLIVSTHKTSVLELVDRVIVLEQGQVASDDPVERVLGRLRNSRVRASSSSLRADAARATVSVNRQKQPNKRVVKQGSVPQGSTV